MSTKIKWDKADFKWDLNPHLWDLVEFVTSNGTGGVPKKLEGLPEDKKKEFIRLIMEYKGITIYDEKKEVQNIKAYVTDVKIIAEEIKRNVQIIY